MSLWDRVKETFGGKRTTGDVAFESDRVVLQDLERARTFKSLLQNSGIKAMGRCERCSAPLRQVVYTTAGSGRQLEVWKACPLAVDGWLCRACGWSAMPRFISPEESVEYGRQATEHVQSGNFDDAEFWFRRILGSWPGYGAAYADLGQLSLTRADAEQDLDARTRHREQAEELFRTALAADGPFGGVRAQLARALALLGREAEALELLRELAQDAEVSEAHREAGRELEADLRSGKGLFTRATELAGQVVLEPPHRRLEPSDRKRLESARELLREAVAREPTFAFEWLLGKTELRLGQLEAAAAALERACAIDPEQPNGQRELASAYMELGRNAEALMAAERAFALRPADATLRCNLAFVLVLTGDLERARREVTATIAAAPTDGIARNIAQLIEEIIAGRRKRPETIAEAEGRR